MGWLAWIENRHALSSSALRAQSRLFGEGREGDHAADRFQMGSGLPGRSGRDVGVADESLPGGDPGGRE
jgi:hypothetical protein